MVRSLVALALTTLAPAAQAQGIGRAALTGHGSWAYVPLSHAIDAAPGDGMMGCGGIGLAFVPEKNGNGGVLPSHRRYSVQLMDVCEGIGAGADTTWLAPLQFGTAGMWGGRTLYVVAQVEGGLGTYSERQPGKSMSTFGITMRPRAALGLQMGPVNVEVGPTYRGIVPLITEAHNSPRVRPFTGALSFDVAFLFGAAGPKRWY